MPADITEPSIGQVDDVQHIQLLGEPPPELLAVVAVARAVFFSQSTVTAAMASPPASPSLYLLCRTRNHAVSKGKQCFSVPGPEDGMSRPARPSAAASLSFGNYISANPATRRHRKHVTPIATTPIKNTVVIREMVVRSLTDVPVYRARCNSVVGAFDVRWPLWEIEVVHCRACHRVHRCFRQLYRTDT
jgi:hypothetical protein